jgi:hypothetical protein
MGSEDGSKKGHWNVRMTQYIWCLNINYITKIVTLVSNLITYLIMKLGNFIVPVFVGKHRSTWS